MEAKIADMQDILNFEAEALRVLAEKGGNPETPVFRERKTARSVSFRDVVGLLHAQLPPEEAAALLRRAADGRRGLPAMRRLFADAAERVVKGLRRVR